LFLWQSSSPLDLFPFQIPSVLRLFVANQSLQFPSSPRVKLCRWVDSVSIVHIGLYVGDLAWESAQCDTQTDNTYALLARA